MSKQAVNIIVASQNPVKIAAAHDGFQRMFPDAVFQVAGVGAESGVSEQPMTDDETLRGALNRARNAREQRPQAHYWVGIEGGVEDLHGGGSARMAVFAWVVVLGEQRSGKARTGTFYLPDEVARLVRQGVELGHADDRVFGRQNSKQGNGAVGLLTHDVIDRQAYYTHAVLLALIPFVQPSLRF